MTPEEEEQFKRARRGRNIALALVLAAFVAVAIPSVSQAMGAIVGALIVVPQSVALTVLYARSRWALRT